MENTAGFVVGTSEEAGDVQKVTRMVPVTTYLAEYVDGAGKKAVKLVGKPEGSDSVYVMADSAAGAKLWRLASDWFANSFNSMLGTGAKEEQV